MTNDIINGIVAALVATFPGVPVHDEPIEQGIIEPSFSVRCVKPMRKHFRGNRYYQEGLYEVVYFPPTENRYQNSNDVVESLFDCLEILTLPDGTIRGRGMESYMSEDFTVVFTVKYSDFLYKKEEKVLMQTLKQTFGTTGEVPQYVYPYLSEENGKSLTEEETFLMIDNEKILGR